MRPKRFKQTLNYTPPRMTLAKELLAVFPVV